MMQNIVCEVKEIVRNVCLRGDVFYGGERIWNDHICVVVGFAKQLADVLGADMEIVEISAWLHDYAAIFDVKNAEKHHIIGAVMADEVLTTLGYPKDKIEIVKSCVLEHRNSVPMDKTSIESVCVASADAMAHIDNVLSLLFLAYKGKQLSFEEGKTWVKRKLKKSWKKMCPEAKVIMENKYNAAMIVLDN